jgi:hypothetical protein
MKMKKLEEKKKQYEYFYLVFVNGLDEDGENNDQIVEIALITRDPEKAKIAGMAINATGRGREIQKWGLDSDGMINNCPDEVVD